LHFRGLGFFQNEKRPRVLWAGIGASPNLAPLAASIGRAARKARNSARDTGVLAASHDCAIRSARHFRNTAHRSAKNTALEFAPYARANSICLRAKPAYWRGIRSPVILHLREGRGLAAMSNFSLALLRHSRRRVPARFDSVWLGVRQGVWRRRRAQIGQRQYWRNQRGACRRHGTRNTHVAVRRCERCRAPFGWPRESATESATWIDDLQHWRRCWGIASRSG